MSKIKITNFGPIKNGCVEDDGWINIKKTTVFIGNQGSGKSTVAKIISMFVWIEKVLVRGDYETKWFNIKKNRDSLFSYHRLENYVSNNNTSFDDTKIEYIGDAYHIKYGKGQFAFEEQSKKEYALPQIMYVPAERNFIAYMKSSKELKLSSEALKDFLNEYNNAKNAIKKATPLPINSAFVEYNERYDIVKINTNDYNVKLAEASSGFQSLVPLYLVTEYLTETVKNGGDSNTGMTAKEMDKFKKESENILLNTSLTEEQKRISLSVLSSRFNKTAFINIVEEPEQNLFPNSQWQLLKELFKFNNSVGKNKLILTTHSPYIVNYLSIAIQADYLKRRIKEKPELNAKLDKLVPLTSTINSDNVLVYQFDDAKGTISKLKDYKGILSDNNYLNNSLQKGNLIFDELLEIEQEL